MDKSAEIKYTAFAGGIFLALAVLGFWGAWFIHATDSTLFNLDWGQILFDAIVLSIVGTWFVLDASWDARNLYK